MTQNQLSISVEKMPAVLNPPSKIFVTHTLGKVCLSIGQKTAEFTTTAAHRVGMAIFKAKLDYNELVILEINNERFELIGPIAKKVATKLLLKADDADDHQLTRGPRWRT